MGAQHLLRRSEMRAPAAGGGGVFMQDSATGTDGTLLTAHAGELGATWTKHPSSTAGDWEIRGNAIRCTAGSDVLYYASGVPATAEYDVTFDVVLVTTAHTGHMVTGRHDTTANSFYGVRLNSGSNVVELFKRVAGTFTSLATSALTPVAGTVYTFKLEIRDAAKKVYLWNGSAWGAAIIMSTDNAVTGAGRIGLRSGGSDTATTGWKLDNLLGTNV